MKWRILGLWTVLALALATVTGCGPAEGPSGAGSPSVGSDGLTTLRVAYPPGSATLPVRLGITQGIFEKHGLKLEGTEGADFSTYIASLGQQYDLSLGSFGAIFPAMRKIPLSAVAGMQLNVEDPPNSVLVTSDPSIQTVEDLAGKRIGFPNVAGTYAQVLDYLLEAKGVDPRSVQYVQVGFAEANDQLKAGNIDAVVSAIPFWTALEEAGHRVLFDITVEAARAATGTDESFNVIWVSRQEFAAENPEVVEVFRAALAESIEFMHENEDVSQQELQAWLGMDAELLAKAPIPAVTAEVEKEHLEPMLKIAEANGVVPEGSIDLDDLMLKD